MPSIHRHWLPALIAASLLASCQAAATPPVSPRTPDELPYTALNPQGPLPADLHELDIIGFQAPVEAPLTLPVTYRRGVEEEVSWDGTGQGTAELWNEYGQLIYRVREGEAPQTLTVGAGRHTLVVTPDRGEPASAMLLVAEATGDGSGLRREILDLAETGPAARPPRGELDPCTVAYDLHERMRVVDQERQELVQRFHLAEHDAMREKKLKLEYLVLRDQMWALRLRHRDQLQAECDWAVGPY